MAELEDNIAICLSGGRKYCEHSLRSIENIIPNKAFKIFIHTWSIPNESKQIYSKSSFSADRCGDELFNETNLSKYNPTYYSIENYLDHVGRFQEMFGRLKWVEYVRHDLGIISMYYSLLQCNLLKKRYEEENGIKFNKIIRMRFDANFYNKKLNLNSLEEPLNIPIGRDFTGLNDQFAVGSSEHMDIYCNLYNEIERTQATKYHPESMLKLHMDHYGILPWRFPFHVGINNRPEEDRGF
tara:strand:- start:4398 stop:5117 length:720 start_codon:yes stop_codon:yes gene_type:complete